METTQEQAAEQTQAAVAPKLSQKDAVYNFVTEALMNAGAMKTPEQKLKDLVTKDIRKVVRQKLFVAIQAGDIKLAKQYDESKLKKYCSGLINNWLKKDPRFNQ